MPNKTCPGSKIDMREVRANLGVPLPPGSYRVDVASAHIRVKPTTRADQLGSLGRGAVVTGEIVTGLQLIGADNKPDGRWLQLSPGPGYVWMGLLKPVP